MMPLPIAYLAAVGTDTLVPLFRRGRWAAVVAVASGVALVVLLAGGGWLEASLGMVAAAFLSALATSRRVGAQQP